MVIFKDQSSHLLYLNIMHKITNLWKCELNRLSKLRGNTERRKKALVTRSCVLSHAWLRDLNSNSEVSKTNYHTCPLPSHKHNLFISKINKLYTSLFGIGSNKIHCINFYTPVFALYLSHAYHMVARKRCTCLNPPCPHCITIKIHY